MSFNSGNTSTQAERRSTTLFQNIKSFLPAITSRCGRSLRSHTNPCVSKPQQDSGCPCRNEVASGEKTGYNCHLSVRENWSCFSFWMNELGVGCRDHLCWVVLEETWIFSGWWSNLVVNECPRWTWMTLERLALFRSQLRWKWKILSHWAVIPGCRGMIRMVSMTNEAQLLECWTSCGRGDCVGRGGRTGDGAKIRPNLHFWRWSCFSSVQILWVISTRILEMKWGTSTSDLLKTSQAKRKIGHTNHLLLA